MKSRAALPLSLCVMLSKPLNRLRFSFIRWEVGGGLCPKRETPCWLQLRSREAGARTDPTPCGWVLGEGPEGRAESDPRSQEEMSPQEMQPSVLPRKPRPPRPRPGLRISPRSPGRRRAPGEVPCLRLG